MSDTSNSFIDEVTEEVQRDRLFGLLRKYGWIPILLVVLLVGGAAWNEYRKAQSRNAAQALGDALLQAVEDNDSAAGRAEALAAVEADPVAQPIVDLYVAASHVQNTDPAAAILALEKLASNAEQPAAYRDLAALKIVLLGPEGASTAVREELIEQITAPGAPYRLLGREQQVYLLLEADKPGEARALAEEIIEEAGLTEGLRQRLNQLILALGGETARQRALREQ
ncbi:MAG: tetratricopeptide repeat protein [Pseudomonadota bacterium]